MAVGAAVNHRRRILHSTRGGPGRWNDQTMVRFDEFISGIRDGTVLENMEFELFELDKDGNTVSNITVCMLFVTMDI